MSPLVRALSFCLLFALPLGGWAQNPDSLRKILYAKPQDTAALNQYLEYSYTLLDEHPRDARRFADEGILLAQRLKQTKTKARLMGSKAIALSLLGNSDSARILLRASQPIYLQVGDTLLWAIAEHNIGLEYQIEGIYDQALIHHLNALPYFERLAKKTDLARLYNNMAVIYRIEGRYDDAIAIYEKSLAIKIAEKDSTGMAATYMNIGSAESYKGNNAQAEANLEKAIGLYRALGEEGNLAHCQAILGSVYVNLGQHEKAEGPYLQAYEYGKKNPDTQFYTKVLYGLGEIYLHLKRFEQAEFFFSSGLDHARMAHNPEEERVFLLHLSQTLRQKGESARAYDLLEASMAIKDSLTEKTRLALQEEMQGKFDLHQKEEKLKVQDLQIAQQKLRQRALWIAAGLLFLLAGLSSYYLYQRSKTARLLREKNEIIAKALSEKELLLKEIHHRVKNNLQFISSLLNLQSRTVEDSAALGALRESRNRVQAMSLIHQDLYQQDSPTSIDVNAYFDRLMDTILASYQIDPKQIFLEKNIEPVRLDVETVVPVGLILNELVCNAVKYAFREGQAGKLGVRLKTDAESLILQVEDDGPGMPKDALSGTNSSFGFRLIRLLQEKLGASLHIQSPPGTIVTLIIPHQSIERA